MRCQAMYRIRSVRVFRIPEDEEMVSYIAEFARVNEVKVGAISVIGALKSCTLGFYDREKESYEYIKIDEDVELANATGNVSTKEGRPFPHIHAIVGKRGGTTYSGHLVEGKVFVAEVILVELEGPELVREKYGGLWLWKPERLLTGK